jgi:hypothetical protein
MVVAILGLVACDSASAPGHPARIEAISPGQQQGTAGAPAEHPPAVRVTNARGQVVAGALVDFTVTAGGGSVPAAQLVTDERGEARLPAWHFGTTAGENTVVASLPSAGSGATVSFTAEGRPGAPARLQVVVEPGTAGVAGAVLMPQPVLRLTDEHGNPTPGAGTPVTASVHPGGASVEEGTAVTDSSGMAAFTWLRINGSPGPYTLSFSAPGLQPASAAVATTVMAEVPGACSGAVPLAFALGEVRRVTLDRPRGLNCLEFDMERSGDQQYLVLFENMPIYGDNSTALFNAARFGQPVSAMDFSFSVRSGPRDPAAAAAAATRLYVPPPVHQDRHSWDFGAGPIYEITPEPPPGGVPEPYLLDASGRALGLSSVAAAPAVGDTILGIWMERLTHLGIPSGPQAAVVRHVSDELIIAEDVRLLTLARQNGGFNTPLHPDSMAAMAREYARHARQQSDLLFDGRHNAAVENNRGGRVLAVHSIMYAGNIWGYTYSSTDYFVFDYWVGTNGSTGGLNQRVQRVVDNLFMHEVAHMREFGMLQRAAQTNRRANTWFVEGFARFTERLPIAARLLASADPSRTGNVVLPANPAFGGAQFRDDVPTYLNAGTSVFGGYQHSSWVFDYFADQVALGGGDWRAALREFVVAAGRPDAIDAVTLRWTGATLTELFTRARIALILDDIGTPGLPAWTQYHQFQLRASRPPGSAIDPRNSFPRLLPGDALDVAHSLPPGGGWGYIIDGTRATGSARFSISGPGTPNAVVSVTRIR